MPTYCAFLGHQPHISLAELFVLLPDMKVEKQWNQQIVTFETKETLDAEWLSIVGGTVLLAKELLNLPPGGGKKGVEGLAQHIEPLLLKQLTGVKRKATFSLRTFSLPRNDVRTLYRLCKQYLKAKGIPSRYIGNERNPAKPGTLLLRGIPGPGTCELVILHDDTKKSTWIGATCAVQDIAAYTERDMGKPVRDTRTGLLPPKLAQILLNLSLLTLPRPSPSPSPSPSKKGSDSGSALWEKMTIWDPFCGSGVIAMEALLRRAHVLASDKSERAVKGCSENLRWLRDKVKMPKAVTHEVWKQNAVKPPELPRVPTLIVTETSLGPPLKAAPTKKEIAGFIREAEELEIAFFTNLLSVLPEVPVVCTFPVYLTREGERHFLPKALEKIQKLGYRLTFPGSKYIKFTDRHTLLYLRPDQFVGREIVCLLPPKKK
jgi:hypothetical protein